MWQLRNGGEVALQSSFLYSALVVTGIGLTLNPPLRKPPTVSGNSQMDKQSIINQLKWTIQALSLEADGQLTSFPDFVIVTDELLLEYDNWYNAATRNYPNFFSDEQIKILDKINSFIEELPQEDLNLSIADELRTYQFWKDLRVLAREALQKFNWTSETPPNDRLTYVRG